MATGKRGRNTSAANTRVFVNVPFDRRYAQIFRALIFVIHDCGFQARCAQEVEGSEGRLERIFHIIEQARLGIHDISRTSLDRNRLPRFNMPLELGVFLGARRYGSGTQKAKSCLILDKQQYRYRQFCSDISGHEVAAHGNTVDGAIDAVRIWLQADPSSKGVEIPSAKHISVRFRKFVKQMPRLCRMQKLDPRRLSFIDLQTVVAGWLRKNADWTQSK